jgi:hypothetical protein
MNKIKNISNKQLRDSFKEYTLDIPSVDFMGNLMTKVEREVIKKKRKSNWIIIGQIASGISAMIFLPALVIYLCKLLIPEFSLYSSFPKINLNLNFNIFSIGFSVMFLLIADTLCRKYIHSKKKQNNN